MPDSNDIGSNDIAGKNGDQCLVITGGSKGIGLATVKRFQRAGFRVVNLSRSPLALDGVTHIETDLAAHDWTDVVAEPLLGAVDGARAIALVHNSAYQLPGGIDTVDAIEFRSMLEINVVAPTRLNRLLLPQMRPGSSILYIGSTMSLRATPGMAAYVACKHAMLGLMRSTCQDLGGRGIHTACICPGFTDTEMLREFAGEALDHIRTRCTQGRLIEPGEIAEFIHFAAVNPVVNGAALGADLGLVEL